MLCPNCRAGCAAEDTCCRHCGADLTIPSTSLVTTSQSSLPAVLHSPQLPRLAAGVGALAVGVGLELLRRGLITRMTRPPRSGMRLLPAPNTIGALRDALRSQSEKTGKPVKLPKGYELHETVIYMSRVIRRED